MILVCSAARLAASPTRQKRSQVPLTDFESRSGYGDLELRKDFEALLDRVISTLPAESHRSLEHVELELSDGKWGSAYGLYVRDPTSHQAFDERVLLFRDTIVEDCGRDGGRVADCLRRTLIKAFAVRESSGCEARLRVAIELRDLPGANGSRFASVQHLDEQ